jgi:hypothetical protein
VCQVDIKEMSPFESDVYMFLIANQAKVSAWHYVPINHY